MPPREFHYWTHKGRWTPASDPPPNFGSFDLEFDEPATVSLEHAHELCEKARHAVIHAFPEVVQVDVHADPSGEGHEAYHEETAHHFGGNEAT